MKLGRILSVGSLVAVSILALRFDSRAGRLADGSAPSAIKFDHALICVSELAPMQQGLTEVGLQPDYGGHHGHATTQMAQLGFPDGTYIGVEAPVDASVETGTPQSTLMKANAGPCGWSVTSLDIKGDLERIARLGVSVGVPEPRSRNRPDLGRWRNGEARRSGREHRGQLPFLIEDKTPRSNRAPHASASIEGTILSGVGIVVLGVKNMDENIALVRKIYGWPAPKVEDHPEFGAKIAYLPERP